MKTIAFRDVLWGSVYKLGMDPARKLLKDQAESLVSYINAWVRRLYPSADWPDWTVIEPRAPDVNHIVSYERTGGLPPMERIFKVYLSDPTKDGVAGDTPFRLMESGVHVGFEHGLQVWLKFIEQAPRFTHEEWDPSKTYRKSGLCYSAAVGECFKSKSNSNRGHDPGDILGLSIDAVTTQQFTPSGPASAAQPKILRINYSIVTPLAVGAHIRAVVTDSDLSNTVLANVLYTSVTPATAPATAFANLTSLLDAALPGSFVVSQDGPNNFVTVQNLSEFALASLWTSGVGAPDVELPISQEQPYVPVMAGTPSVRQLTEIIFSPSQAIPLATYELVIIDGAGVQHIVTYVALRDDNSVQIILGLIYAIGSATDPFFENVFSSVDPASAKLTLSFGETVSVDLTALPLSSPHWEVVPFPLDLADQVMRGAYADLLKEQGQADKASAEEQLVPTENTAKTATLSSQPYDPLTDQQRPRSRYKVT